MEATVLNNHALFIWGVALETSTVTSEVYTRLSVIIIYHVWHGGMLVNVHVIARYTSYRPDASNLIVAYLLSTSKIAALLFISLSGLVS